MSTESAVFVDDISVLGDIENDYDRLYFGNEFCDKRLPASDAILDAYEYAEREQMEFSYVTPILTPLKSEAILEIFDEIESVGAEVELIFNDWGVFSVAEERSMFDDLVAGRVLSRQKRDPTVTHLQGESPVPLREDSQNVSQRVLEHFQKSVANASYSRDHLSELGVDRVELDVLSQGVYDEEISLTASLYYPWNFLTVKRWCRESTSPPICNEACDESLYTLDNRPAMPDLLYRKNNVVFLHADEVPDVSYVDREVFVPEPIN